MHNVMKKSIKEPVRLRAKEMKNGGKSLYLDCYVNGSRTYEFLKLYLIPERTQLDKERNATTLLQAEAHKAKRVIELQQGKFGVVQGSKINRVMLSDYIIATSEDSKLSKNCKVHYKITAAAVKQYGDTHLQQVDKTYIEGFIKHLNSTCGRYGKTNKESTQAIYLHKLTATLNRAVREGLITSNPVAQVEPSKKPHAQQAEKTHLTLTEVERLSATECRRGSVKRAFLFACFCGLRISDIRALRWCDIKTTSEGVKQVEITQQKTRQRVYLPLSANALKWLPERPDNASDKEQVFRLLPIPTTMQYILREWASDAGITKPIHFHVSRHTFATLLLTFGADLYTVSKLMGHTNISTTQVYAKIVDSKKTAAVNMIPTL